MSVALLPPGRRNRPVLLPVLLPLYACMSYATNMFFRATFVYHEVRIETNEEMRGYAYGGHGYSIGGPNQRLCVPVLLLRV